MSRPSQVLPNQFYQVTRRCTQRQFLLRPDDETNNTFAYCLAEAALRFDIVVLHTVAESNHHHTTIFDRHGRQPRFREHFHKMLARCQNAYRGRWENLWAAEEPCVTRLLDRAAVIDKLIYACSNPVKDLLVERAVQWPGVNGYRQLLSGKAIMARRPRHFFSDDGVMPETVTLDFVIPPELGRRADVIADVRAGVEQVEAEWRAHRSATNKSIVGRAQVLKQSWRSSPTSREPRRKLRPRFAGHESVRVPALLAYREFLDAYAAARECWVHHRRAVFPIGTYWIATFTPAAVTPLPRS